MKKLAICISGVPRGYYCVDVIQEIAKYNDVTLFIWYWNDGADKIKKNSWLNGSTLDLNFNPEIFNVEGIKYFYKSGSFEEMYPIFEKQRLDMKPVNKIDERQDVGIISMTYAIKMANQMREDYEKENNMVFDCVMRARFELSFNRISKGKYYNDKKFVVDNFDMNILWRSHSNVDWMYGMNDCLAFSGPTIMSHYSTLYDRIKELSEIDGHAPEIVFHHNTKHFQREYNFVLVGKDHGVNNY